MKTYDKTNYLRAANAMCILIEKMNMVLELYEDAHLDFAQLLFEEGCENEFTDTGALHDYQVNFVHLIHVLDDSIIKLKQGESKLRLKSLSQLNHDQLN